MQAMIVDNSVSWGFGKENYDTVIIQVSPWYWYFCAVTKALCGYKSSKFLNLA